MAQLALKGLLACMNSVMRFQLVLEAELFAAAVTFVGLLPGMDALVALQRTFIPETATTELALVWMVTGM